MRIENESKGEYTCSRAPYTRFTSVGYVRLLFYAVRLGYCFTPYQRLCLYNI